MSHFDCLVLVKDNVKDVEKQVKLLLDPYSEDKRMPKYEKDCHCIGDVARREAQELAEKEFPSWDALREQFHQKHPEIQAEKGALEKRWKKVGEMPAAEKKALKKLFRENEKKGDRLFHDFIAPKQRFIEKTYESHPMRHKPDPTCGFYSESMLVEMKKRHPEDKKIQKLKVGDRYTDKSGCGATGKVMSNYNPKSQWDWWEIGGRWTGALVEDYDPYTDPDNLEPCWLCKGTGKRDDEGGRQARAQNPNYTCNGCDGKGKSVKHQLKRFPGDILPARLVPDDYFPHALVTPDGEWHQESTMGWFGMTGKGDPRWEEKVAEFLKQNLNTVAVVVDCHI